MKWLRDPLNPCFLVPCRNMLQKQCKAEMDFWHEEDDNPLAYLHSLPQPSLD